MIKQYKNMKRVSYYSVSAEVARLSGSLATTYRTKDGRFILSEKQVKRIPSSDDKADNPDIVEIPENEARRLIQLGGYQMGEKK